MTEHDIKQSLFKKYIIFAVVLILQFSIEKLHHYGV